MLVKIHSRLGVARQDITSCIVRAIEFGTGLTGTTDYAQAKVLVEAPGGDQGPEGPQGIQGPVGNDGATGDQGIQGPPGDTGAQGSQGIQGVQGPAGNDGARSEER